MKFWPTSMNVWALPSFRSRMVGGRLVIQKHRILVAGHPTVPGYLTTALLMKNIGVLSISTERKKKFLTRLSSVSQILTTNEKITLVHPFRFGYYQLFL